MHLGVDCLRALAAESKTVPAACRWFAQCANTPEAQARASHAEDEELCARRLRDNCRRRSGRDRERAHAHKPLLRRESRYDIIYVLLDKSCVLSIITKMLLNIHECLERYGSYYAISKEVAAGSLVKIERGIYSDSKECIPGEGIVHKKYPNAVFTMESAFLYHRLTDVVPDTYSIATPVRTTAIADKRVKQYFVPEGTLEIGKTEMEVAGVKIAVYDLERMLIELMRYRRKLPYDYYKEVLGNYRSNLDRLYPAKLDDYLAAFPKHDAISRFLDLEVF